MNILTELSPMMSDGDFESKLGVRKQMKRTYIDRARVLKRIIGFARSHNKTQQRDLLCDFITVFYRTAPLDSIDACASKDLYGAACSLWGMLYKRMPGIDQCRLFNADDEKFPWQCEHSLLAVVTDAKPFLVDSLRIALMRAGCTVYSFINATATCVERASSGQLKQLSTSDEDTDPQEAYLLIEISYTDPEVMPEIEMQLMKVLHDVRSAVEDWRPMQLKMHDVMDQLEHLPRNFQASEVSEIREFFRWLLEYFTFIGYREYEVTGDGKHKALTLISGSGLGVLSNDADSIKQHYYSDFPKAMREHALSNQLILITKTNTLSTVHRATYTDIIICKVFDQKGKLIGERRFIGLFTSDAYDSDPSRIPLLRQRVKDIIHRSIVSTGLYERKRLLHILKRLPRDELFQATSDELQSICIGVLDIQERRVTRLFARKDVCNRFVSCLIYVPRDNYSTELRIKMQRILMESFQGQEITANPMFSESTLAAVHFLIRIDSKQEHVFDVDEIEYKIVQLASSWRDEFEAALLRLMGAAIGHRLFMAYQWAFSASFRSLYSGAVGAQLVQVCESLEAHEGLSIQLTAGQGERLLLRIYQLDSFLPLSDAIPILENMGMRTIGERLFEVKKPNERIVYISEFTVEYQNAEQALASPVREAFHEALRRVWVGKAESDRFNHLVLFSGIQWFEVRILRAYARYLKQISFSLSEQYIQATFSSFPDIARQLVALFQLRFDPELKKSRNIRFKRLKQEILHAVGEVDSADQDRIIRNYIALIEATTRVNVYKTETYSLNYLSFKINSALVPDLPLPRPLYEIFVFSERVEGIHLRAGKVARGGIRWSDRREDFRTEILGLMKAQQGKNALIVPAGAKGGFITKKMLATMTAAESQTEAIECYKIFISGLLDLTDNLAGIEVIKPKGVISYDDDDPYLVVAADRGTATFSDTANELSKKYGFWLMDAFASGGSTGYDHKKMGITARGTWASVEWHFKSLNRDITKPFTVVGIGGMAGDVFGNGMLLSNQIQLVAAFNHEYIFIDPNPDPVLSFKERKRLFKLTRAKWINYNTKILSRGGGVYGRHDKFIELSVQAQKRFGLDKRQYRPEALIQILLCSEVDLIWNGGIGTFVRSMQETDAQVGDHNNDVLRVEGQNLRCRMFGEGGNLGLTQLARIEYELSGGRINTDFIDNSAGVDCSDHEVNIKIFLNEYMVKKRLTFEQRNALLVSMTDDVAEMVLKHNADQNLALSLEFAVLPEQIYLYEKFMENAVQQGVLDPVVEYLPTKQGIAERLAQKKSLTRPELAVLLSYSKIILQDHLVKTDLVNSVDFKDFLDVSFPQIMLDQMGQQIWKHPLRKEIIATHLSNTFVNELGITFLTELSEECALSISDIISAYMLIRKVFNIHTMMSLMRQNQPKLSFDELMRIYSSFRVFIRRSVRWMLRNKLLGSGLGSRKVRLFSKTVHDLLEILPPMLRGHVAEEHQILLDQLRAQGISTVSAQIIARISFGYAALNIAEAALKHKTDINIFAPIYFIVSNRMKIYWVRSNLTKLALETHWDLSARYALKGQLDQLQRQLSISVYLEQTELKLGDQFDEIVDIWFQKNQTKMKIWQNMVANLSKRNQLSFAIIFVLLNELRRLTSLLKHP